MKNQGQALITLLFFTIMALMIATTAIAAISTGSIATGSLEQEEVGYYSAESGIENAILRLIRNPSYAGETMNINSGTVVISVSGSNPYTIDAVSTVGNIQHKVEVNVNYNSNGTYSITSWSHVY